LQKQFPVKITFRQLMGECASLERLAARLDAELPPDAACARPELPQAQAAGASPPQAGPSQGQATPSLPAIPVPAAAAMPLPAAAGNEFPRLLNAQQMQLMAQQLALLSGQAQAAAVTTPVLAATAAPAPAGSSHGAMASDDGAAPAAPAEDDEATLAH